MNSIEKTLAVMRALGAPDGPHRLASIAQRAGTSRPSAHRILQTLVEGKYAYALGDGFYTLGMATRALAGGNGLDPAAAAAIRHELEELQRTAGHTVHFAVRSGDAAVYLFKIEGDKPYQMASRVGMQIMLHCTAIGKAILSTLPDEAVDSVLERTTELRRAAGHAAGTQRLHRELDEIRNRGYSVDDEENEPNVRCVGVAVRDADGEAIGGISVSGLALLLPPEQLHTLGPTLGRVAKEISRSLGYRYGSEVTA